jgi:hypothetical protein
MLRLVATLYEPDTLQTTLLPGFALSITTLFEDIPKDA